MAQLGQLGEMLGRLLSDTHSTMFFRLGGYRWFSPENEVSFRQGLEPLAYAVRLGLKNQVQSYFSYIVGAYQSDLLLKASYIVRKELGGDGGVLGGSDFKIVSLHDLDTLLPSAAFNTIERLAHEGFVATDFSIAEWVDDRRLIMVLRIGDQWLKVMSWEIKGREKK